MQKLTQDGTYRGKILAHGVSETKNGYPQFNGNFVALEMWDEDEGQWVDYSEYDAAMMGYFVLVGGDNTPLLNMTQVMKAIGWDGQSFAGLDNMDLSHTIVQFRLEWKTYEGNESLQVTWIDHENATPGIQVKKLDAEGLKNLDSKYNSVLRKVSGKSTPVATKKDKEKKEPVKRGRPPKVKKEENQSITTQPCDLSTAWKDYLEQAEQTKLTEDRINEIWIETIELVANDKDEDDITEEEWGQIRAKLLAHEEICPF